MEHTLPSIRQIRGPFGDFTFCDVQMHPGVKARHRHDALQICFASAGAFEQSGRSHSRLMDPSTVRVSPPGTTTDLTFGPAGARCLLVELTGGTAIERARLDPDGVTFMTDEESVRLVTSLQFCVASKREPPLVMETLALELFARANRPPRSRKTPTPQWLRMARDWLHDRFKEELRLTDAALELGITPVHLSRAFREQYGCTMGTYLQALRIEYVSRRLASDDQLNLAELALDAGFFDQSHMTRVFRRFLGTTPSSYRAVQRGMPSPRSQ